MSGPSLIRKPNHKEIPSVSIQASTAQRVHVANGRYLGLKVGIWEPLWALSIYHIPTWTLNPKP